jgi:hypothetical protein
MRSLERCKDFLVYSLIWDYDIYCQYISLRSDICSLYSLALVHVFVFSIVLFLHVLLRTMVIYISSYT